jgi:predicted DNA-binding transcriptional regulator AlpA
MTELKPIGMHEVCALFGNITRQTLRTWVRDKKFPAPLPLGNKKLFWNPLTIKEAILGNSGN